jgi:hypothetical protein
MYNPNEQRDHFWWQMYVASRDARERVAWNQPGPAAWYARQAVRAARKMLALEEQPRLPIPDCSICLSDDCLHEHVCE